LRAAIDVSTDRGPLVATRLPAEWTWSEARCSLPSNGKGTDGRRGDGVPAFALIARPVEASAIVFPGCDDWFALDISRPADIFCRHLRKIDCLPDTPGSVWPPSPPDGASSRSGCRSPVDSSSGGNILSGRRAQFAESS
jgi:hypothetical protein